MSGDSCEQNGIPSDDLPNQEKNQYWTPYYLNDIALYKTKSDQRQDNKGLRLSCTRYVRKSKGIKDQVST